jgi:hypothetical protein
MRFAGFVPYAMKTSEIRVTSYDEKIIRGTLSNPFYGTDVEFNGLVQLVLLLENLQDELNYPQRAMDTRSFTDGMKRPELKVAPPDSERHRALATFRVSIYFRQNASWQGSVVWTEREQSACFRSVLELMMLVDGALCGGEKTENDSPGPAGTVPKIRNERKSLF